MVIPRRAGSAAMLAATGAVLVDDDAPATLARGIRTAMRGPRPAAGAAGGLAGRLCGRVADLRGTRRVTDRRRTVGSSIDDVAPQTLPAVDELTRMVRAAAGPVPASLLVVPRYHGGDAWPTSARDWSRAAADRGDEIVLHGYEHQTARG